jgi:hypothetical protein
MRHSIERKSQSMLILRITCGFVVALSIPAVLSAQGLNAPAEITLLPRVESHDAAGRLDAHGRTLRSSAMLNVGRTGVKRTSWSGLADTDADYYETYADGTNWFEQVSVGYDRGFVIASQEDVDLQAGGFPFRLQLNGWGQLRHTIFDSQGPNRDINQFQLKRARLVFSGSAFTRDFTYFVQLDGRSTSGDDVRLLDYFLAYDIGHHLWGCETGTFGFKTGKYKVPFTMARYLSGREFEFADRSMASTYFDVNRSLAWGLYGRTGHWPTPLHWETAIFNGLVTSGAETGSSGTLDNNFAYSARLFGYPLGDWGDAGLADLSYHSTLATRIGAGAAFTTIERDGITEFNTLRVVDSGDTLASILPTEVDAYNVSLYSIDTSCKFRGWSLTTEYYFRNLSGFQDATLPDLFDHGIWFQLGKFVVPGKLQLLSRWSRVVGNSGTLGLENQSADEIAGGLVWYFRGQHARLTLDVTHLDGAPIRSAALDMSPGDVGWLFRTQIQFAF